jgi:hypothetical protein
MNSRFTPVLPNGSNSPMDLTGYRTKQTEIERIADLMRLVPKGTLSVLDVGARDGHLSKELANHCPAVTALDLVKPSVDDPRVHCVKGDATDLKFLSSTFDVVLCAEVLEHIPSPALETACFELGRVAKKYVLIGVPYKQDTRHGRTTCYTCGGQNPPWAHVNVFDEVRLQQLFPDFEVAESSYVGEAEMGTNFVSAFLMDAAGNPYGTYHQEEPCVHCGMDLQDPPSRTFAQKVYTKTAYWFRMVQRIMHRKRPNWIHVLMKKAP